MASDKDEQELLVDDFEEGDTMTNYLYNRLMKDPDYLLTMQPKMYEETEAQKRKYAQIDRAKKKKSKDKK